MAGARINSKVFAQDSQACHGLTGTAEEAPEASLPDPGSVDTAADESAMDDLLTCLGIEEQKAQM